MIAAAGACLVVILVLTADFYLCACELRAALCAGGYCRAQRSAHSVD